MPETFSKLKELKCIVFDFDGPIFDGRKAAAQALEETVKQFNSGPRPLTSFSTLPLFSPKGLISFLYRDLDDAARVPIRDFYAKQLLRIERELGVPESVRAALNLLTKADYRLAIFSSRKCDNLNSLLRDLGLATLFSFCGCSPEFSKPSGDCLKKLSQELRIAPADLLFVGDSDWDYLAAKDAGVTYYHACWTGEPSVQGPRNAKLRLASLRDLVAIAVDTPSPASMNSRPPEEMFEAVPDGQFAFYAGAGISIPSGIGRWEDTYLPVMERLGAGYLREEENLPAALQLLAANPFRAKRVFDAFQDTFRQNHHLPNSYHFAMLRAEAEHIWTSNYDQLFEDANQAGQFGRRIIRKDQDLLDSFRERNPVVKMNGDFQTANFDAGLDWGLVFLEEQFDKAEKERPEIWRLFEDDYRHRSIIFVGVSFRDPALHRILALARQKISRTRYNHYLLAVRESDLAARTKQYMFAENLRRASIETIFLNSHDEVQDCVRRVAMVAYRPIVGFSGDVGLGREDDKFNEIVPEGMAMTAGDIARVCRNIGQELARRKIRVTSGCAPYVGKPAVEAAFSVNPPLARFYLRKQGGSAYARTAPAIVVPEADYEAMRLRFLSELSALIAIGGRSHQAQSGTLGEIDMAFKAKIPVILVPAAGGEVQENYQQLRNRMLTAYNDDLLRQKVLEINDTIMQESKDSIIEFARDRFSELVEDLLSVLMGSAMTLVRAEDALKW